MSLAEKIDLFVIFSPMLSVGLISLLSFAFTLIRIYLAVDKLNSAVVATQSGELLIGLKFSSYEW